MEVKGIEVREEQGKEQYCQNRLYFGTFISLSCRWFHRWPFNLPPIPRRSSIQSQSAPVMTASSGVHSQKHSWRYVYCTFVHRWSIGRSSLVYRSSVVGLSLVYRSFIVGLSVVCRSVVRHWSIGRPSLVHRLSVVRRPSIIHLLVVCYSSVIRLSIVCRSSIIRLSFINRSSVVHRSFIYRSSIFYILLVYRSSIVHVSVACVSLNHTDCVLLPVLTISSFICIFLCQVRISKDKGFSNPALVTYLKFPGIARKRFLRIFPKDFYKAGSVRVEIFGCPITEHHNSCKSRNFKL